MERRKKTAFSLAELMITLLILSIVLSAVMPAVTKRNAGQESVWRWLYDGSHGYFGTGAKQEALIGMSTKPIIAESPAAIPDYRITGKEGDPTFDAEKFTLTDIGDRLLIMKYTYNFADSSKRFHPMSNSHITFFSSSYSGGDETIHYAGRLSMDETNIAIGKYTMAEMQDAYSNVALDNLALGQFALFGLVAGYENIAIGNEALYANGQGFRNTALGFRALTRNVNGYENNSLGFQSMFYNIGGNGNNAVGHMAGYGIRNGNSNTALGSFALKLGGDDVQDPNGGIQDSTLGNNNGNFNTAVGYGALHKGAEVSNNTAIGNLSGAYTTTGADNLFAGAWSGFYNSTGSNNVMLGIYSGLGYDNISNNEIGSYNTFVGSQTGYTNSSGAQDVFIGADSGYSNTTGANNTFLGYQAGYSNTTGANNVYIGNKAGYGPAYAELSNQFVIANGENGIMLQGQFPVSSDDTESKFESLAYTTNINSKMTNIGKNTTDQPVIFIDGTNDEITFGGKLKAGGGQPVTAMGGLKIEDGSIDAGGGDVVDVGTLHAVTVIATSSVQAPNILPPSDRRLKDIIGDAKKGLSTVDAFKIVRFKYKNDEQKLEHIGVIAQDLQKILPTAVVKMPDGFLSISLNDIIFTIAKAVQELHQAVLDLAKEVKSAAAKVTSNSQKIEALEKENAALKQQISDLDSRLKKLEEAK